MVKPSLSDLHAMPNCCRMEALQEKKRQSRIERLLCLLLWELSIPIYISIHAISIYAEVGDRYIICLFHWTINHKKFIERKITVDSDK